MSKLEVEEDVMHQERTWDAQRVAWFGLGFFLLSVGLGYFGPSDLTTTRETRGGVRFEYPRFVRNGAAFRVKIVRESGVQSEEVLSISNDYLERVSVESALPDPIRQASGGESTLFYFSRPAGTESLVVTVELKSRESGFLRGSFGLGTDDVKFPLSQVSYF
jgi:hypothetical protein